MTDRLAAGFARLTDRLRSHASQVVTYGTPDGTVDVLATLGRQLLRLDDGQDAGGVIRQWTDMDVLVPAADLVISGVAIEPERGHTVYLTEDGSLRSYEVYPYGGEPPWRWADPYHHMLRIHLKRRQQPLVRVLDEDGGAILLEQGGYLLAES